MGAFGTINENIAQRSQSDKNFVSADAGGQRPMGRNDSMLNGAEQRNFQSPSV